MCKDWIENVRSKVFFSHTFRCMIVCLFVCLFEDSKCAALVANGYVQLLLPLTKIEETKEVRNVYCICFVYSLSLFCPSV